MILVKIVCCALLSANGVSAGIFSFLRPSTQLKSVEEVKNPDQGSMHPGDDAPHILPDDTSQHPIQIVSSKKSPKLKEDDSSDENSPLQIISTDNTHHLDYESVKGHLTDKHDTVAVTTDDKLDAAVDKLQEKMQTSGNKDANLEDLIDRVKKAKAERANMKRMVMAYSVTQLVISASSFASLTNPLIFAVFRAVDYVKKELERPLILKYARHQRAYARLVAEILKNYPQFKTNITKMPKKLIIKTKNGKDIVIDIIDEEEDLKEEKLHLETMGPMNIMATALQMR